jgi:hypothetical protein
MAARSWIIEPPRHHAIAWLALLGVVVGGGCGRAGPAVYPAAGHVQSADGRRATFGVVELTSLEGGQVASGRIEQDGTFRLSTFSSGDGAVAGRHRLIVVQIVNTERVPLRDHHHVLDVHLRHARYETSGLECQVEPRRSNYLEVVVEAAPVPRGSGTP